MKYRPLLLAASLCSLAGCQQHVPPVSVASTPNVTRTDSNPPKSTRTYAKLIPALPPPGMVRIVPQKLQSDAKTVHWKWTIVGDRNWSGIQGDAFSAGFSGPYPLNSTKQLGGSNVGEYEITFTASNLANGNAQLETYCEVRTIVSDIEAGHNKMKTEGSAAAGGGPLLLNMKHIAANEVVKPLLTEVQTLPLPLDKPVLEVTAKKADGTTYRQSFRLKIAK